MTTRTWNGSIGNFNTAADWSPTGVPAPGDVAIINTGTVSFSGILAGVAVQLNANTNLIAPTTLFLSNAFLDASSSLTVSNANPLSASVVPVEINITGTSVLTGTTSFYGSEAGLAISYGSTLVNTGTINIYAYQVSIGGGTFTNNGTIAVVNPTGTISGEVSQLNITSGSGTVALGRNTAVQVSNAPASSQTYTFNDGAGANEFLILNSASASLDQVEGFSASDRLEVGGISFTSATYTSTGASSGVLNLFSGSQLSGSLAFRGNYSLSDFSFTAVPGSEYFQPAVIIQTSASVPVNAGLPPAYQNSAVYRFFDTANGTQFLTANATEKNTVLATRSDLVQEANSFGDVALDDPNKVAVYRFFNAANGTHFFTDSASERDAVIATRPDLIYEANSTVYEHSTQQNGDVAVYRFFDERTGTQFLTGSQSEFNGLTTPGAATYRADLRSEGVAFYAPGGTST